MAELETVYVTHDFEAENEDEIPLRAGETVLVIEKDEEFQDGWWRGRNAHGEIGLFPMNYTSRDPPNKTSIVKTMGSLEDAISAMQVTPLPPPPTATAAPPTDTQLSVTEQDNESRSQQEQQEQQQQHTTVSDVNNPPIDLKRRGSSASSLGSKSIKTTNSTKLITSPSISKSNLHSLLEASLALDSLKHTNPDDWTIEQVSTWVEAMGFKDVVDTFKNQEITGDVLMDLTPDSLKELNIGTFGKRHKLYNAIQALRHEITNENDMLNSHVRRSYQKSIEISTAVGLSQAFPNNNEPVASGLERNADDGIDFHPSSAVPTSRGFNTGPSISAPLTIRPLSPDLEKRLQSPLPEIPVQYTLKQSAGVTNTISVNSDSNTIDKDRHHQEVDDMLAQSTIRSNDRSKFLRGSLLGPSNNKYGSIFSVGTSKNSVDVAARGSMTIAGGGVKDEKVKPDAEGWLHKQSDKYRTWNKRWFVLQGLSLYYFKSPKDLRVKGIINLDGYKVINDESIHAGSYCFKLQHDRERTFFFYTDSDQSMKNWMRALMKATISRNYNTPVLSSSTVPTISLETARRMRPRPPSMIMHSKDDLSFLSKRYNSSADVNRPHSSLYYTSNNTPQPSQPMRVSRSEGIMASLRQPPRTLHSPPSLTRNDSSSAPVRSHNNHYAFRNNPELPTMFDVPEEDEDLIDPRRDFIRMSNGWKNKAQSPPPPPSTVSNTNSGKHDKSFGYIQWINQRVKYPVTSLDQLRSGEILIEILENISGKSVRRPPQSTSDSMRILDTIVAAFKFMGREGIRIDGSFTIKGL
ncbi:hypothetical protein BX666DRAFT_1987298 [Dichotomocladium elegans]|nr:hypothetical protein BX666DRAFT_1987298 [Dichotomocladium elegans]